MQLPRQSGLPHGSDNCVFHVPGAAAYAQQVAWTHTTKVHTVSNGACAPAEGLVQTCRKCVLVRACTCCGDSPLQRDSAGSKTGGCVLSVTDSCLCRRFRARYSVSLAVSCVDHSSLVSICVCLPRDEQESNQCSVYTTQHQR